MGELILVYILTLTINLTKIINKLIHFANKNIKRKLFFKESPISLVYSFGLV